MWLEVLWWGRNFGADLIPTPAFLEVAFKAQLINQDLPLHKASSEESKSRKATPCLLLRPLPSGRAPWNTGLEDRQQRPGSRERGWDPGPPPGPNAQRVGPFIRKLLRISRWQERNAHAGVGVLSTEPWTVAQIISP